MKKQKTILVVFGTRPEVIKLAPVIIELKRYIKDFKVLVLFTGQHREMVEPLFKLFKIKVDIDLNIMKQGQTLDYVTQIVLEKISEIIKLRKIDLLMVQGDTTTAMAAGMAAFYSRVKVAHVEAGLRTYNTQHPYPEEFNRRVIDSLSDIFFSPTTLTKNNLLKEGVSKEKILITGNTVIDSLMYVASCKEASKNAILHKLDSIKKKIILVTAHRRENFGEPFQNILQALQMIAKKYPNDVHIVYPVHLNPNVKQYAYEKLSGIENIDLIEPVDYLTFVQLMKRAYLILTDSGGIQEEAPSLNIPVIVMREVTEREEAVKSGAVKLVGTKTKGIVSNLETLLRDKAIYRKMAKAKNPYGDGRASVRIAQRLLKEYKNAK